MELGIPCSEETAPRRMGLSVIPSVANFLLADVGRPGAQITEALLRRGVIVRPVGGYGFPTHLRITIGTAEENAKCVAALRAVLGTRQLPQLPSGFPNPTLTVHLNFEYTR